MSTYHTTDVDLAAFLECRGFQVQDVDAPQSPPWHAGFVFPQTDSLDVALRAWHASEDGARSVDARQFADRRIKLYRWARSVVDAVRRGR